ncbi:VOC family protein [Pedobacter psychrodurus]|uniref:VOC family protein n=1 Tax=Pedobacter psychrodurus TaxID=2530456 RepID=UPI00292E627E|nr:VOC family protein [Pedobacter psychrodurus]
MYININAESREDADRLFNGLSTGGKIEMPMEDMFWGDYFGSFKDRFGIQWMVNFGSYK